MTTSELVLIEKLIQKSIETEISKLENKHKTEINEVKSNLSKIGKLVKSVISEGSQKVVQKKKNTFVDRSTILQENDENNDDTIFIRGKDNVPRMGQERSNQTIQKGDLPEFDAPIFIHENSQVMKELMEKLDR